MAADCWLAGCAIRASGCKWVPPADSYTPPPPELWPPADWSAIRPTGTPSRSTSRDPRPTPGCTPRSVVKRQPASEQLATVDGRLCPRCDPRRVTVLYR